MPILDYRGQPVAVSSLTQEVARPSLTGIRQTWFAPTGALTPTKLASIIAAVDQNEIVAYLTLAEEMEEVDLHYHSVLSTRKLAVAGLSVIIEAPNDKPDEQKLAEEIQEIVKADYFCDLLMDQLDALGKGYSVSEIMWDKSESQWQPKCFEWRDPRHFMFDRETGRELRMRDAKDVAFGVELVPYKFVQHRPRIKTGLPIRGGLARLAVISYMAKSYALKDWLAFAEIFGMPLRVGKYGPTATPAQTGKLLEAVAQIGTDAACIIPDTMMIEFEEAAKVSGGDTLFQGLADWLDSQVSKGVLGQTMTTDAKSSGLGSSNADAHDRVRQDIKDSDAKQLAATLRRDFIRPYVDLNYGPRKLREYPVVRLMYEEPDDLKLLSESLTPFIDRGLPVEVSTILDKFGLPTPDGVSEGQLLTGKAAPSTPGDPNAPQDPTRQNVKSPTDKPAPDEPSPEDAGNALKTARSEAYAEVMRRVKLGVRLTKDQQTLLSMLSERSGEDEIDRLAAQELKDWRRVTSPITDPVIELVNQCESFDELKQKLSLLKLDEKQLVEALALLTFKARGLGDATDKVRRL